MGDLSVHLYEDPGTECSARASMSENVHHARGSVAVNVPESCCVIVAPHLRDWAPHLLGALAHLPAAAHEAARALLLPLPPHGGGGLLPWVGLVPHGSCEKAAEGAGEAGGGDADVSMGSAGSGMTR